MEKELKKTANNLANKFKVGGESSVIFEIREHQERVDNIISDSYKNTMNLFAERVLRGFKSIYSIRTKEETPISNLSWEELRNNWITENSPATAKAIADTTFSSVSRVIQAGLVENLSNVDIAKQIVEKLGGSYSEIRAMTIARTETHSASQSATNEVAKTLTIKVRKQWISASDERVRTGSNGAKFDHKKANGETVDFDKMFKKTGQDMEFPGDKNGSVGNYVNCRCVMIMVEVEEE